MHHRPVEENTMTSQHEGLRMSARRLRTLVTAGVLVSAAAGPALTAQAQRTPPLVPDSLIARSVGSVEPLQIAAAAPRRSGAQLFRTYCASCHGLNAHGDGALAERLRHAPPDLTAYSKRNNGVFPSERVYRIIDGREVPSHGDRDMPVWGDAFRSEPDGLTADEVKARIEAIVGYLRDIQRRDAH
jgi:mono/diheme cytochrome c family protein